MQKSVISHRLSALPRQAFMIVAQSNKKIKIFFISTYDGRWKRHGISRSSRSAARITAIRQNRNARTCSSDRNCAENVFKMDVQHHGRKAGGICGRRSGRRNREDPSRQCSQRKWRSTVSAIFKCRCTTTFIYNTKQKSLPTTK